MVFCGFDTTDYRLLLLIKQRESVLYSERRPLRVSAAITRRSSFSAWFIRGRPSVLPVPQRITVGKSAPPVAAAPHLCAPIGGGGGGSGFT